MNTVLVNVVSALSVSAVITIMAKIKSPKLKAIVYSLPVPASVALMATGGKISGQNILGLITVISFLWLVYYLHTVRKVNILLSDVVSAIGYVVVAYILAKFVKISLKSATILFVILWGSFVVYIKNHSLSASKQKSKSIELWKKSIGVFLISLLLFSMKGYLAAFVVTFPFSGVFAVYEGRHMQKALATIFAKNSLAFIVFFHSMHIFTPHFGRWWALAFSWATYCVALYILLKLIPLKKIEE